MAVPKGKIEQIEKQYDWHDIAKEHPPANVEVVVQCKMITNGIMLNKDEIEMWQQVTDCETYTEIEKWAYTTKGEENAT